MTCARWCVLTAVAALAGVLVAVPAGGSDSIDIEPFRPRMREFLDHFMSGAEEMQCDYPNKRRWWESLSEEGIEVVSTRNSRALFRAVRECLKVTEIESGDVERSKAVLTEFLAMRRAAESAAGITRTGGQAEKIMREQREKREWQEKVARQRLAEEGEECRDGWVGEDCDKCAPGHGGELCEPLAGVAGEDHDCMEGWAGDDCDECAPGYGGELCKPLAKQ